MSAEQGIYAGTDSPEADQVRRRTVEWLHDRRHGTAWVRDCGCRCELCLAVSEETENPEDA